MVLVHDVKLALAYAKRRVTGQDVAVLFNRRSHAVLGIAVNTSTALCDPATCVVNLLQNACNRTRDLEVATTATPSDLCLGMLRICQIKRVIYLKDGTVFLRPTATTIGDETPAAQGNQLAVPDLPENWTAAPTSEAVEAWARALPETDGLPRGNTFLAMATWNSLAAKELPFPVLDPVPGLPVQPLQEFIDAVFLLLSYALLAKLRHTRSGETSRPEGLRGHNIACVMVNRFNLIVGWGINTTERNATHHGEVNCIQGFQSRLGMASIPDGGCLYTTLEPCWMCAALIARTANTGGHFRVVYGQRDENLDNKTALRQSSKSVHCQATQSTLSHSELQTWGEAIATAQARHGSQQATVFLDSSEAEALFNQALQKLLGAASRFIPKRESDPHFPMQKIVLRQAMKLLEAAAG